MSTTTPDLRIITEGLRFPEGPVAMPDGSIALVEIDGPVPADVLAKVQALPQVKQAKALVF